MTTEGLRKAPGFESFDYDFLGSTNDLRRAVARAEARWREATPRPDRTGSEVLIGADGKVLADRLAALLSARDDRGVTIKE